MVVNKLNNKYYAFMLHIYMGQQIQDEENHQHSSFYFFKDKAGVGWEMKVSKFGQVFPFPNGWDVSIIEEILSKKYFH